MNDVWTLRYILLTLLALAACASLILGNAWLLDNEHPRIALANCGVLGSIGLIASMFTGGPQ